MRFGLAYRPDVLGGPSVFVALYLDRNEVGNYADAAGKMYVFAEQAYGFAGIYDKKGNLGGLQCRTGVPVIFWWPYMHEVVSGSALALLRYHRTPQHIIDIAEKKVAKQKGLDLKSHKNAGVDELRAFGNWAKRIDNNATRIVRSYEEIKEGLKRPENARFKKYLDGYDNKYEDSFIVSGGLEGVPDYE